MLLQTVKQFKSLDKSDVSDEQGQDFAKHTINATWFDEDDAARRVAGQRLLKQRKETLQGLKDIQEEFGGLTAKDKTILDQTEYNIDQLIKLQNLVVH